MRFLSQNNGKLSKRALGKEFSELNEKEVVDIEKKRLAAILMSKLLPANNKKVVENNRLDQSFGSTGTSAGIFLVLMGIIVSCLYFSGLILVIIGGFVGFTYTSVLIDYNAGKVKFSNNIFGFIPIGKWIPLDPSMKIGIRKSNLTYRAYSRGNRALDIDQNDFRLVLFDSKNKEIMPLKKFNTLDVAKMELETLAKQLGLALL